MRRRQLLRAGAAAGIVGGIGLSPLTVPAHADVQNDPYEPLGRVPVDGAAEAVVGEGGDVVYVAAIDGFATVDVSDPAAPTVLTEERDIATDAEDGPISEILDVDVSGDRLAVPGPANPSRSPPFEGFVVYDVSDPANPVPATEPYETGFPIHNCALEGDLLFTVAVANDRNPLVIHDVSGDAVEEVGRWSLLEADSRWDEINWPVWNLHDVTVHGDVAVLAYWDAGTHLVDVSDPTAPTHVAGISGVDPGDPTAHSQLVLPGNDHYAVLDDDGTLLAVGKESWARNRDDPTGPGGIDLFDVSDPTDPTLLATIDPPDAADETYRGGLWTTAHNFELRDGRLLSSWYRGGVKIHDVTDPTAPEELAWWRDPERAAFWTARVATPGEVFVASSTGILPNSPTEGALYTFPIRSGEQADPPSLTEPSTPDEPTDGDGNETGNGTGSGTDPGSGNESDPGSDTGSESDNESGSDTATDEGTTGSESGTNDTDGSGDGADGSGNDEDSIPGFTGPATIVGGGIALEWARRRSDERERPRRRSDERE